MYQQAGIDNKNSAAQSAALLKSWKRRYLVL